MTEKKENSSARLLLLSLTLARSAVAPPLVVLGLLLIEISVAFGVSVGVAGQISAASSFLGILFALLMGALSVRFNHKSLLVVGLILNCVSALGCSVAPSFQALLLMFSLSGLGSATVISMVTTLIGDLLSQATRTTVLGWTAAGTSIVYLGGTLLTNLIVGVAGWRMAFLGFVFPLSLLSLLLTLKGVPSPSHRHLPTSEGRYVAGFTVTLSQKSAVACLASPFQWQRGVSF